MSACRRVQDADVVCVHLDRLPDDVDALTEWGDGIPVQLVMTDPAAEFSALYRAARLVETIPYAS